MVVQRDLERNQRIIKRKNLLSRFNILGLESLTKQNLKIIVEWHNYLTIFFTSLSFNNIGQQ